MSIRKIRVLVNPRVRRQKVTRGVRSRQGLFATVHWGGIWLMDSYIALGPTRQKQLVKIMLDGGISVRGYWQDIDYSSIDKRIGEGIRPR